MEILHIQLPDWSTLALLAYETEHILIACIIRFWCLRRLRCVKFYASTLRCVRCVRCVTLETALKLLASSHIAETESLTSGDTDTEIETEVELATSHLDTEVQFDHEAELTGDFSATGELALSDVDTTIFCDYRRGNSCRNSLKLSI